MTRLSSSVVLLAMFIAGGCAATAGDEGSTSESAVHVGNVPDAAAPDATSDATPDATDAGASPRGPSATTFTAKLAAAGLDVSNLPSLHDLPMNQKMKVMRTFNESMGVQCNACHDLSDYSIETKQKEIARAGWDEISRGLVMADGSGALYCDSCHYGKLDFLDRSKGYDGIAQWMADNFVAKLADKSGEAMACTTCHKGGPPPPPDRTY